MLREVRKPMAGAPRSPEMTDSPTRAQAGAAPGRSRLLTLIYLVFIVLVWAGNLPIMKLVGGTSAP